MTAPVIARGIVRGFCVCFGIYLVFQAAVGALPVAMMPQPAGADVTLQVAGHEIAGALRVLGWAIVLAHAVGGMLLIVLARPLSAVLVREPRPLPASPFGRGEVAGERERTRVRARAAR